MDTFCQITIYAMEDRGITAEEIIDGAFSLCEELENLLSKTREGSDVWNINQSHGKGVKVSQATKEVVEKALEYGELSQGKFNIGIGRVTDLWDFHALEPKLPEEEKLKDALNHVDYTKIKLDGDVVTLEDPEMLLDLGGIAKGYISDQIALYLKDKGVTGGVVDLGGNISVLGTKDGTEGRQLFRVGIKKPFGGATDVIATIDLKDSSVVTSGVYERYFELDGERYHHILDGETGYPVQSDYLSVSVVGPIYYGGDCDALATSILLLDEERVQELIKRPELKDYGFLLVKTNGEIEQYGRI